MDTRAAGWTSGDLDLIGSANEVQIAPTAGGGTNRPYTTIWVVRVGDDLYVRSYRGAAGRWYRQALQSHQGRIRASGVERDITFVEVADNDSGAVDDAYRHKYGRSSYVDAMMTEAAAATTLRVHPR